MSIPHGLIIEVRTSRDSNGLLVRFVAASPPNVGDDIFVGELTTRYRVTGRVWYPNSIRGSNQALDQGHIIQIFVVPAG